MLIGLRTSFADFFYAPTKAACAAFGKDLTTKS
jgi:hypothetical protein